MFKKISLRLLLFTLFIIILQTTCMPYYAINGIRPDLVSALFLAILFRYPTINAIYVAFFIGLIKSLFSNYYFGVDIVALVLPATFFPFLIRKADLSNIIVKFLLTIILLLIHFVVFICIISLINNIFHSRSFLYDKLFGITIYTAIMTLVIDKIVHKIIPRKTEQYELF